MFRTEGEARNTQFSTAVGLFQGRNDGEEDMYFALDFEKRPENSMYIYVCL